MRPSDSAGTAMGLFVMASVVLTDQATKVLAVRDAVWVPRNPSYAFGVVSGSATVLVVGALCVLGAFAAVAHVLVTRLGASILLPALVAGGAMGNVLDRIRLGAVRDFLVTPWAIINVADLAVAAGIIGLVITLAARVPRLRTLPARAH